MTTESVAQTGKEVVQDENSGEVRNKTWKHQAGNEGGRDGSEVGVS